MTELNYSGENAATVSFAGSNLQILFMYNNDNFQKFSQTALLDFKWERTKKNVKYYIIISCYHLGHEVYKFCLPKLILSEHLAGYL